MSYSAWRLSLAGSLALVCSACGESTDDGYTAELDAGSDAQTESDAQVEGDASNDAGESKRDVTIAFEAKVGEQAYDCSSSFTALNGATSKDFRMYVYDVRLITESGSEVPVELTQNKFQYQNAALLDFEDATGGCADTGHGTPELHRELTGQVASGSYKGVAFRVGLPSELNHSNPDSTPAPLDITHLSWMWTHGRIYLGLDLVPADGGGFPIHLGARGCVGDPEAGEKVTCARPNIAEVRVDSFDPDQSKVVIDLAELLADVQVKKGAVGEQPGCMSQPELQVCKAVFTNIGVSPEDGSPQTPSRTVFRAASRN